MRRLWLLLMLGAPTAGSATLYETLSARIEAGGITTLEQALAAVPSDQFSHYTLMYAGEAAQGGSPGAPRAIVYGKDAKSILTFTGDATKPGYDRLELMEFREEASRFELAAITFPSPRNRLARPALSGVNPRACLGCHGRDPHPIWSPYSEWPGAYGRSDDELYFDEERNFLAFRATMPSHPRYRFLPLESAHPKTPYLNTNKGELHFRPNFYLLLLLSRYQSRRLARLVHESAEGKVLATLHAAAAAGCGGADPASVAPLETYFGSPALQLSEAKGVGYWEKQMIGDMIAHRARISPADWLMRKETRRDRPEPLGVSLSDIPGYRFFDGTAETSALVADALYRRLARADARLAPAYATNVYFSYGRRSEETRTVDALGGELKVDVGKACPLLLQTLDEAIRAQKWGEKPKPPDYGPEG